MSIGFPFKFLGFPILLSLLTGCAGKAPEKPDPTVLKSLDSSLEISIVWKKVLGGNDSTGLRPAIYENFIIAAGSQGRIVRIENDGVITWDVDLGDDFSAGVGAGLRSVIIQKVSGVLVSLDLNTGAIRWETSLPGLSTSQPVVDSGLIFVKTNDSLLFAISEKDGSIVWRERGIDSEIGLRGTSPLIVDKGNVFVLWESGRLASYVANDGRMIWEKIVSTSRGRSPLSKLLDSLASPSIRNGLISTATSNGQITLTEQYRGSRLWRKDLDAFGGSLLAFNQVIAVETDGTISSFSLQTGDSLWSQKDLKYRNISAPGILHRYIVVTDFEGWVHFIDPRNGIITGRINIGNSSGRVAVENGLVEKTGFIQLLDGTVAKIKLGT